MTKRKVLVPSRAASGVSRGRQYPGVQGKIVDFADHAFEDGTLASGLRTRRKYAGASSALYASRKPISAIGKWEIFGNFESLFTRAARSSNREGNLAAQHRREAPAEVSEGWNAIDPFLGMNYCRVWLQAPVLEYSFSRRNASCLPSAMKPYSS
jgi:hypothetical protein